MFSVSANYEVSYKVTGKIVTEGINSDTDGALSSQSSGDLTLDLSMGLTNNSGLIDETVFGGVVLGSHGSEQGLFSTQDLDGGGGVSRKKLINL